MIADIALASPPMIVTALGLYLMYRVLGELDLSVDATFTAGASMVALAVTHGLSPWLGLLASMAMGALISLVVFAVHRIGRTQYLLASLIVYTGMYSVNLHILGGATVGLIGQPSIFDIMPWADDSARIVLLFIIVAVIALAIGLFLNTSFGLTLRAAGNNPVMARANRIDTRLTLFVGALGSGALFALGGALQAQVQGYADITMGIGAVIISVAVLFLGELIFPHTGRIVSGLVAVIVGGFLYTGILTLALRSGLPPTDLRLATASILIAAVLISRAGAREMIVAGFSKLGMATSGNRKREPAE